MEINPFANPLGYNLARQDETNRFIVHLKMSIKEDRIKDKVIKYVEKYRNKITEPERLFDNYVTLNNDNSLLNKLIEKSPLYRNAVSGLRQYEAYCKKLFSIAGLYSLEDRFVRFYFYTFVSLDKELKKKLKDVTVGMFSKSKIKKISSSKKQLEERIQKYLCYTLHKTTRASFHSLGRRFKAHKDTIRNWVKEVDGWADDEKSAVMQECRASRAIPNIDMLDLPSAKKTSSHKLEFGLTESGMYKTGRKSKPRTSYKSPEED